MKRSELLQATSPSRRQLSCSMASWVPGETGDPSLAASRLLFPITLLQQVLSSLSSGFPLSIICEFDETIGSCRLEDGPVGFEEPREVG